MNIPFYLEYCLFLFLVLSAVCQGFGNRRNDFGGFLDEDVLYSSLAYSTARRVVSLPGACRIFCLDNVHKHGQPR